MAARSRTCSSSARSCCAPAGARLSASSELGYTYRHSALPEGCVVVAATFRGHAEAPATIQAEMDRIAAAREASQPLRSRTGGSTFKNPPGTKAWQAIDHAGCRGLRIGDAQVSEKHCNFLLNLGDASSADIEALGEEVRRGCWPTAASRSNGKSSGSE